MKYFVGIYTLLVSSSTFAVGSLEGLWQVIAKETSAHRAFSITAVPARITDFEILFVQSSATYFDWCTATVVEGFLTCEFKDGAQIQVAGIETDACNTLRTTKGDSIIRPKKDKTIRSCVEEGSGDTYERCVCYIVSSDNGEDPGAGTGGNGND